MMPDEDEIETVFMAALEASDAGRAELLDRLCAGRSALRADVDALLAAHGRAHDAMPTVTGLGLARAADRAFRDLEGRAPLQPGARIAHYQIEARLGAGGMGEVFRARDLALDRPAAIKVVRRDFDREFTKRLVQEVEASARLQHPAIATFFEGGEDDGRAYFAMELVEGETLRHRLGQGPLPITDAIRVTADLLEALAHAHAAGILHRDIKPENIMLGSTGRTKLLDFGLARAVAAAESGELGRTFRGLGDATAHGTILGTPGYMSPEQLRAEPVGPPSDLFQIGCVLYEMLTGRRAFGDGPPAERIAATLAGPPDAAPLQAIARAGLADLVLRTLAHRPADRFGSAGACLLVLDHLQETESRTSIPPSVAILDFSNTTGDPEQAWLSVGLAEQLRTDLARVPGLTVAPRAATTASHGGASSAEAVALALGLRWAITGAYERRGDDLAVTLRVIEASTGRLAHATTLEGAVPDLFDLQARLADACTTALDAERRLFFVPRSGSARAFELHARARQILDAGKADPRAIALLEEAVADAPDYVPALSALVSAFATRFITTADVADLERALAWSERTIALDPGNSEAWAWRGYAFLRMDRTDEALVAVSRAVEVDPRDARAHYVYGAHLLSIGRTDEALSPLRHAMKLEPRFGIGWLALGWAFQTLAHYDEARFAFVRAKALEGLPGPTSIQGVGGYLAESFRCEGRLTEARAEALAGLQSIERSDHLYRDVIRAFCLGALGRVALLQGDRPAAEAAFSQAIAQMRGRTRTQGGGHVLVHALAGLARTSGHSSALDEALALFDTRSGYSFKTFYGCFDWFTLLELARSARAVARLDVAEALYQRAVAARCREAM